MKKNKRLLAVTVAVGIGALLVSCVPARKIKCDEDGGVILDAQVVPTSFNECQKMQVKTSKIVVVIVGFAAVPVGKRATIRTYTDGWQAIMWEGDEYVHFIY